MEGGHAALSYLLEVCNETPLQSIPAQHVLTITMMMPSSFAVDDMWTVANNLIVDLYSQIVKISTVLAGLMSAVAVIGAKLSNNQHKVDQAWDWLRRIWIAWVVINGIGAFIAYIAPKFSGLATLTP